MFRFCCVLVFAVSIVESLDDETRKLYHTSEQVDNELIALSKRCKAMQVIHHPGKSGEATITSVSIKQTGGKQNKLKVLLFFGEHSRELISVESGLSLIQHLCNEGKHNIPKNLVDYNLNNAEFLIFTNIGVNSRRLVEKGKYCLRVNHNGVDLNRNWKDHWKPNSKLEETSPGKTAFSEDETIILRDATKSFRPDLFLTVHSGTLGMYIPYAYSTHIAKGSSTPQMLEILHKMNPKYCNCDVGAAGKQVGYLCPGTCLDYIYDIGTKYSFAFEIYEKGNYKHPVGAALVENGPGSCLIQKTKPHNHEHHHDAFPDVPAVDSRLVSQQRKLMALQKRSMLNFPNAADQKHKSCLEFFNPVSKPQYEGSMQNWVSAYLELVQRVNEHHITK